MALIDVLRKKQQQITQQRGPAPASVQGMQQQIATGMTGKAQQQQGPAVSGIGQQIAQQQAQAQQQALSQQQEQQATQLAQGIEQQQAEQAFQQRQLGAQRGEALASLTTQEQMAAERRQAKDELADMQLTAQEKAVAETLSNRYANALADLASERGIVENNIFQDLANERKSLSADKYLAALSQRAHVLAMSDRRYVAQIQQIGAMNDLRDTIEFKKEAQALQFGENLKILSKSVDQQRLLNADKRQFAEEMSKMSLDDAFAIAEQALKAQETSAIVNTMLAGGKTFMSETDWNEDNADFLELDAEGFDDVDFSDSDWSLSSSQQPSWQTSNKPMTSEKWWK